MADQVSLFLAASHQVFATLGFLGNYVVFAKIPHQVCDVTLQVAPLWGHLKQTLCTE